LIIPRNALGWRDFRARNEWLIADRATGSDIFRRPAAVAARRGDGDPDCLSGLKPIYFSDTPSFNQIAMGSVTGRIVPGLDIPNAVFIFFLAAFIALSTGRL